MVIFLVARIENIVGKGENAGISAFSLFCARLSKVHSKKVIKNLGLFLKGLNVATPKGRAISLGAIDENMGFCMWTALCHVQTVHTNL